MTDTDWTEDDARRYVDAQTFTYAKSVPQSPHEYLLAERSTDPEGHKRMVEWVNRTGTPGRFTFEGRTFTYRYAGPLDGRIYWVSRPPPWGTPGLILNRRKATSEDRPAVQERLWDSLPGHLDN